MHTDDGPLGHLLSRREVLVLLGAAAFAPPRRSQRSSPLPSCVARPRQTEGPYFVDERLNRSDIRSDPTSGAISAGVPLALTFLVSEIAQDACRPLPGAQVDVWQCDAMGVYSDVDDPGFTTVGKKFLRGYQVTDRAGQAAFQTVYPGWYAGRTVHIHFKVRTPGTATRAGEFTSQIYFDDDVTDRVFALPPYAGRGRRSVRNGGDGIFRRGGDQLLVVPESAADRYTATFSLGLQLT